MITIFGFGYLHPPKPFNHGTLSIYTIGYKKLSYIFHPPDYFFFLFFFFFLRKASLRGRLR